MFYFFVVDYSSILFMKTLFIDDNIIIKKNMIILFSYILKDSLMLQLYVTNHINVCKYK